MVGLLGNKLGQTRVYASDGSALHVTVVECGPNHVVQCKTPESDGYSAVQLAFDPKDQRLVSQSLGITPNTRQRGSKNSIP